MNAGNGRPDDISSQEPGSGCSEPALTWALVCGADDGNRTRTISLGICAVQAVSRFDLRNWLSSKELTACRRPGPGGPDQPRAERRARLGPAQAAPSTRSPPTWPVRRRSCRALGLSCQPSADGVSVAWGGPA